MRKLTYAAFYRQNPEDGYDAVFPEFPELTVHGFSLADISKRAADALILHVLRMQERGCTIPEPRPVPIDPPYESEQSIRDSITIYINIEATECDMADMPSGVGESAEDLLDELKRAQLEQKRAEAKVQELYAAYSRRLYLDEITQNLMIQSMLSDRALMAETLLKNRYTVEDTARIACLSAETVRKIAGICNPSRI